MGTIASRSGDLRRWITATPHRPAVAVALLGLLGVSESIARATETNVRATVIVWLCLLSLFTTLPTAFPRPAAAAATISAANVLSIAIFHNATVAGLTAQLIILYRLGRSDPGQSRSLLLAMGLAAPFLVLALAASRPAGSETAFLTVLLAALAPAASLTGIARRARREATVHRAARQAIADAMVEHTGRGERARIARELHDVVAHHISMIAVQAETARLATPGMPAAGATRLLEIGDTARAGLTQMRRLLGVLREDTDEEIADLRPQPGLRQLNDLLDHTREGSGAATRLIVSGRPVTLDPGVELAAYRIVQEALTNARRHAPGAAIDVELRYTDDILYLRIRDNGFGSSPDTSTSSGGHGLHGMRERAVAVGGELSAGPVLSGGFLIKATFPANIEASL